MLAAHAAAVAALVEGAPMSAAYHAVVQALKVCARTSKVAPRRQLGLIATR